MAVTESNKVEKLKFVTLTNGSDGIQKQLTTTLSNLAKNIDNDSLMAGAKAYASLLKTAPAIIAKVTEVTLTEQV